MATTHKTAPTRTHCATLQEAVSNNHGTHLTHQTQIAQNKVPSYKTARRVKASCIDLDSSVHSINSDPIDATIKRLVDTAPQLTKEQRMRIRSALGGGLK